MANLKDLIVNGAARVIGKVYAPEFVGKLTGNADTATTATNLGTSNVGSNTTPIYLSAGTPTATSYTIAKNVPANAEFTDTKVTAVGNHYTPSTDNSSALNVDASSTTSASWNSTSLVTGVNISRDAKGHVTGLTVDSIKMPANPDTDTHYTAKNVVASSSTETVNVTAATSNPYLNLIENGAVRSTHQIKGSGATTVKTDTSGNIVISSTDTNTTYSSKTAANGGTDVSLVTTGEKYTWNNKANAFTVSNGGNTASWGKSVTVGTVAGTALTFTMPANPNTDTHYTAKNVVASSSTETANVTAATSNPYINLIENGTVRSAHQIKGSGATTVKTDTSGNITISSTDTNTHYTATPVLGATDAVANATSKTSDPYLNIVENGGKSGGIRIKGSGATSVSAINGIITISSTDTNTTYSSKTAASGGSEVSLVTTGEKYTWNSKADSSSLAKVATSGSYTDLSNKPTILTKTSQLINDSGFITGSYLPISGGTLTGDTTFNRYLKINAWPGYGSGTADFWYNGDAACLILENVSNLALGTTYVWKQGDRLTGAVFNDLADAIPVGEGDVLEAGYCYGFDGEHYAKTSEYMQKSYIGIHSDTYGFKMGHEKGKEKLNVAISGFVLAYVDKEYEVGTPLTCTVDGCLTEIKLEDKIKYPERVIATYWKSESNEEWGPEGDKIKVNGRKWVKVK